MIRQFIFCQECGKPFPKPTPYKWKIGCGKYCSKGCRSKAREGKKRSEETKKKMSESRKGRFVGEKHPMYGKKLSEETKRKISEANKGKISPMRGKKLSEETKRKISEANTGKRHSEETKREMSKARRGKRNQFYGKKHTEDAKRKMSEAQKGNKNNFYGKTHSEEHKIRMSEIMKDREFSEEHKRKISEARVGWKDSEETRRKKSESHKGLNTGEKHPNWRGGISCEPYCPTWHNNDWRSLIYERDKDKLCWNPLCWGRSKKIHLHHINYDKKDCALFNIIKVCDSCNSRANHNRRFWQIFYEEVQRFRTITVVYENLKEKLDAKG